MLRKAALVTLAIFCLSILPVSAPSNQSPLNFDHPSGPIGAKLGVNGNLTVPDTKVGILFDSALVATSMTASNGTFKATFYVPPVGSGDHIVTAYQDTNRTNAITATFQVMYGINDIQTDIQSLETRVSSLENLIALQNNTLTNVNNQTAELVQSRLPKIQKDLSDLQGAVSALGKVLNPVANSITSLAQNVATGQAVASLQGNVSELSKTLTTINRESSTIQLLLIILQSSIAVSIILGVSVLYVLKRRRGPKSDDWEVFE